MTTLNDIGVSALVNVVSAIIFFLGFMALSLQPMNDRVYKTKLYIKGVHNGSPSSRGHRRYMDRYFETDYRQYLRSFTWVSTALRMSEKDLIEHAGLDAVVYLRIYIMA